MKYPSRALTIKMKPGEEKNCTSVSITSTQRIEHKISRVIPSVVRYSLTQSLTILTTSRAAKITYGDQARINVILCGLLGSLRSPGAMCPIQRVSQLSREPKSKISLGIRKPLDDVKSTSTRPTRPPIREGNSGPNNQATVTEGTVIASEA